MIPEHDSEWRRQINHTVGLLVSDAMAFAGALAALRVRVEAAERRLARLTRRAGPRRCRVRRYPRTGRRAA